MQARGLNYRLKFCWLKVICCTVYVNQTNLNVKLNTSGGGNRASQKFGGSMAHLGTMYVGFIITLIFKVDSVVTFVKDPP